MNVVRYQHADGWHTPALGSKVVGVRLAEGQKIRIESPGGGGWGDPAAPAPDATMHGAARGTRRVWFGGWTETPVHERLALPVGAAIAGPAILEQPDTTIVVEPGYAATTDRFGNIILAANSHTTQTGTPPRRPPAPRR